jgi:N-acetylglucosaminyl-diphospho-decaprenol L-rhamnosyltransferase
LSSIAAVIVTYNSEAEIGPCLDALRGCSRVIVVDNASADATVEEASKRRWAHVISNPRNRGFAAAVNQGVRACDQPLLLLLNPDAVIASGFAGLAESCRIHGIAAGKLVHPDGSPQHGFTIRRLPGASTLAFESLGLNRLLPSNPVNRLYRYAGRDLDIEGEAEQPAGAFLMVRRDVFDRLGGFDESFYPVWFEDVDFAARARGLGYTAWYVPEAVACHAGGHSVRRLSGECRALYWYVSLLRYTAKHFRAMQFRTVCGAVAAGCALRLVTGIFVERGAVSAYKRVIRLAVSSGIRGRLCTDSKQIEEWSELEAEAGRASCLASGTAVDAASRDQ